jgi:hypothetical protein
MAAEALYLHNLEATGKTVAFRFERVVRHLRKVRGEL